jgi:polar amino acid transport system substrate-binding protein
MTIPRPRTTGIHFPRSEMHHITGTERTRRSRIPVGIGAAGIAISLLLTGCASAESERALSAQRADNAAADLLPADVVEAGTLKTAAFLNYPPYHYLDKNGKPAGINPALARAVADHLGLDLKIEDVPFESLVASVQTARYDFTLTTNAINADRLAAVDILAWKKSTFRVLTSAGNPDHIDINNLCGVSFATTAGSTNELALNAASAQCEAAGQPALDVLLIPDGLTEALVSGRVKAVVNDAASALAEVAARPGKIEALDGLLPVPGFENPAGWMFPKGSELEPAIQASIKDLIEDGTWGKILEEYGLTEAGYLPPVLYTEMPAKG